MTDFPTLNMTAAIFADKMRISIGARPGKAMLFEDAAGLLKGLTNGLGDVYKRQKKSFRLEVICEELLSIEAIWQRL